MSSSRLAFLLALATLVALAVLCVHRPPLTHVWADEGTYLAMTESLVEDGDLRFDEGDRARLEKEEAGRSTVILERSSEGEIAYSKPVLFSLVAAPFFALGGVWGVVVLNALVMAAALLLGRAHLRRLGSPGRAALTLVTFACASVLLPYVFWRMSDILQAAFALAGGVLVFAHDRGPGVGERSRLDRALDRVLDHPVAPYAGAALLGLVVSMRLSNGTLAMVPIVAALLQRRFRRAVGLAAAAVVAFGVVALLTLGLIGSSNPYRSSRTSFNSVTGYPAGEGAAAASERFTTSAATHHTGIEPSPGKGRVAYSSLYFLIGRHTGLLVYFPAVIALLWPLLRRLDAIAIAGLLGFGGLVVFLVGWLPWNYFGGETFIGNRYLLPAYALLPALLAQLPGRAIMAAAWMLAVLGYGSALVGVERYGHLDDSGQSHTLAGAFRVLPYESTVQDVAGRRDRYWSGDFVRFVDPFAKTRRFHFELTTGMPGAELMVAQGRLPGNIRLEIETEAAEATLVASDFRHTQRLALGTKRVSRGLVQVDLDLAKPWRHHVFWWDPATLYHVRLLRLRLETPDGASAVAKVRYCGDPTNVGKAFAYERLETQVPANAIAGTTTTVRVRLRNTSQRPWEVEAVLPVHARTRLFDAQGALVFESPTTRLPKLVNPGEDVELALEVSWPKQPGHYRFEVDLVLQHIAWFADRLGMPVVAQEVEIRSP